MASLRLHFFILILIFFGHGATDLRRCLPCRYSLYACHLLQQGSLVPRPPFLKIDSWPSGNAPSQASRHRQSGCFLAFPPPLLDKGLLLKRAAGFVLSTPTFLYHPPPPHTHTHWAFPSMRANIQVLVKLQLSLSVLFLLVIAAIQQSRS